MSALFALLLCWAAFTAALDIKGAVIWNDVCQNSTILGQATASLDEGVYYGSITKDGRFTIPDVPDGTFIISVASHDFSFDTFRIDVANASTEPVQVRPYTHGAPLNPPSVVQMAYPVLFPPKEKTSYFVPPQRFNLGGMLANPMILLMIGAGAMVLATPYLMKNMDPEALEELKEQQKQLGNLQNALSTGDFKGGLSALMAPIEEASANSKGGSTTKTQKSANKRNKR